MGTADVASDACTHPGGTVTWVRVQPRCTWTSSALGGRRRTHMRAARPALDLTQEAGQAGTGSPDKHMWTCHEAVGQVTQHNSPPRQTDSQMGHVAVMPRHNRGTTHPKVAKALCSGPARAWTNKLDCLSVPRHVPSASVLETLSPCSSLWLPITLPV